MPVMCDKTNTNKRMLRRIMMELDESELWTLLDLSRERLQSLLFSWNAKEEIDCI
jgi:hypothetical protein